MPQALPANPNLDWLKKTAKQRLVELRAASPMPGCIRPSSRSPMTTASRVGAR